MYTKVIVENPETVRTTFQVYEIEFSIELN